MLKNSTYPELISVTIIILIFIMNSVCLPVFASDTSARAAQFNLTGMVHLKKGNYKKAERFFKRALRLKPYIKYYYNNHAAALIRMKRYRDAKRSLKRAILLDSKYVKALSNMAVVCFRLGQYMSAYRYYKKAKAADRYYVKYRFDRKKMIQRFEKLSRKYPHNKEYQRILRYLNRKQ